MTQERDTKATPRQNAERRGWPAFASGPKFDRSGSDHRVGALCPWPAVNSRDRRTRRARLMKSTMTSRRSVGDRQLRGSGLPRRLRDCWAGSGAAGDRPGQPARRFGNGPLLHLRRRRRLARGGPSQPPSDRHVLGRAHHPPGLADRRQGEREPADQPCRVRGQPQGREGDPRARAPDQGARRLLAGGGRCRRAAHPRNLPPHRPRPRERHAARRRSAERPHRRRLRDQRGRQDRHQGDPLRRQQPRLFELAPARSDDDDRVELPQLPQEHRRLRSRPARLRPGADPPLLPQERLRRFPRAGDRRAVRRRRAAARSSPSRSRRASNTGSAPSISIRASATSIPRRCAAASAPRPGRSTTPRRSSGRSPT